MITAGKPSAPQTLRVTEVSKDYATLTWEAPESAGGTDITGYTIEKRDLSKTSWVTAGTVGPDTTSFKVPKLFEGCKYMFRVAAENKIGLGETAELTQSVTAKLPYGEYFMLPLLSTEYFMLIGSLGV